MKKVILDVDTGVDDALAIVLAEESKQLEILGITAVNGNVPIDRVMENTTSLLRFMKQDRYAVYRGASRPLIRNKFHEYGAHGTDGLGGVFAGMDVNVDEPALFAPDFIIEQIKKYPKEITLIMVGPLTNLALAIQKAPNVIKQVKEVIVMGGLVQKAGYGNTLPTSEFNMHADAEAARIVFHAGLPLKLVSLDVTSQTMLTKAHIDQLAGTYYYDFVLKSTELYRAYTKEKFGLDGCALHDPLTVGIVLDSTLVKTDSYYVDIETISRLSYGQTICDFRYLLGEKPNVEICMEVDHKRFVEQFLKTLSQRK